MERIFTDISKGPHCASLLPPRVWVFLAFALWAFNAPFPGTLSSTSLPRPSSEPCYIKLNFPGCSSGLAAGCWGRAANHGSRV